MLGLNDAMAVLKKDASATMPSKGTVEAGSKAVAERGYTEFLMAVADA